MNNMSFIKAAIFIRILQIFSTFHPVTFMVRLFSKQGNLCLNKPVVPFHKAKKGASHADQMVSVWEVVDRQVLTREVYICNPLTVLPEASLLPIEEK